MSSSMRRTRPEAGEHENIAFGWRIRVRASRYKKPSLLPAFQVEKLELRVVAEPAYRQESLARSGWITSRFPITSRSSQKLATFDPSKYNGGDFRRVSYPNS